MKRQVLFGLTIMLVLFFIGGLYIVFSIGGATQQLENAVVMHSVADFNNEILNNIRRLQSDLQLLGRPQGVSSATVSLHADALLESLTLSDGQRYPESMLQQQNALHKSITVYTENIAALLQTEYGPDGFERAKADILMHGDMLAHAIEAVTMTGNKRLTGHAEHLLQGLSRINNFIVFMVVIGPLSIWLLTAFFLQRFTGSVHVLVDAAKVLKGGQLDYRIDGGLKHEFKELADSFNSMSSKLKKERDELQSVRQLYQTLFESAGEGILILDLSFGRIGRIVSANQAAAAMHGYSVAEMQNLNIADLNSGGGCDERLQYALDGVWTEYEVERRKKDGSRFLAEVSVGLLDVGNEKYALAFTRDITQRKKEESELQRANQMALVGEMAAGLAHEIKNPLAGIKVSLEVLADELTLSEEDQELFSRVINETNRVEKLLKGLLSYARPPKLQLETFDLNKLLDNSIKNIFIAGRSSSRLGVDIERSYAENLPPIEADSAQLQQVLLNIFLNAIEVMDTGGRIFVSTRYRRDNTVKISIADTGKGLSASEPNDIFQPFYTTKSKGTGLGLAICKRIIEEHGGSIGADGNRFGGATFTIILPLTHQLQDVYDDKKRSDSAA